MIETKTVNKVDGRWRNIPESKTRDEVMESRRKNIRESEKIVGEVKHLNKRGYGVTAQGKQNIEIIIEINQENFPELMMMNFHVGRSI